MRCFTTNFYLLLFSSFLFFKISHANELPSAIVDTARLNTVIDKIDSAISMLGENDDDSAIAPLREHLIAAADSPQAIEYLATIAGKQGVSYRNKYTIKQAILWHKLELELASIGNINQQKISALNNIGLIYRRTDKYEASIEAYQQALTLAEATGDKKGLVYAMNGLGNIHLELGNYDEALNNFRECLRQEQIANNMLGIAINLNNIGHVYKETGDLDKAMEYFMLSLEVNQEIPSQRGIAICFNDIGEILLMRGEKQKALEYFELSLNLNQTIEDLYYLGMNHLKIAEILLERKDFAALTHHLDEAIRLSQLTLNRSNLMKSHRMKYQTELAKGNLKSAIEHLEKAWNLNDSILNENNQRKVLQMQATFNRERANNRIALLQNEKMLAELRLKRQKDYTWIIAVGSFFLVIGLGLLAHLLLSKNRAVKALRIKNIEVEQARLQLAEYNSKLLKAKQEAEQSSKLKSQFLANMSHEIRTPLNSVIGFSDLLSEKITDPVKLSYIESIRSAGRSLLMLIDDILDLSKIEAGKLKPELQSMSLNNLFLELRRIFELQAYQKNILLKFSTSPGFPEILVLHEGSLRQILVNLIGNALKFTDSGQIEIEAFESNRSGDICDICIRVSDTGRGIPEEDQANIFEAFYQASGNQDIPKGTGLGLAITRRLVELLNGSISFKSKIGEGTSFEIVFPKVKTLSYRTAFRLAGTDRPMSQIALLCNDNYMLAHLNSMLTELGINCDLYQDLHILLKQMLVHPYKLIMWDQRFIENSDALPETNSDCIHVLLMNEPERRDKLNVFEKELLIPRDLKTLKSEISLLVFGQNVKPRPKTETFSISTTSGEEELTLIEAYQKAMHSQLLQDVHDFARLLKHYGENKKDAQLQNLGIKLKQAVQAIDIELMNTLLDEFGQRLTPQPENV